MDTLSSEKKTQAPDVAIVMAAGFGTRMRSRTPKVLHRIAGRPLLYYPIQAAFGLGVPRVVVVVNEDTKDPIRDELAKHFESDRLSFVVQAVPRGTGDAVRVAFATLSLPEHARVLILSGDTPLLESAALEPFLHELDGSLTLLSFRLDDPRGYGRIMRAPDGSVKKVVEERDLASAEEGEVREVNAGVYCARASALAETLPGLQSHNAQGEYYFTDIVADVARRASVRAVVSPASSFLGVNDRAELWQATSLLQERIRQRLARSGITIVGTPLIDDTVEVEPDVTIEDGVRLRGRTRIGSGSTIDVGAVLTDARIGTSVTIRPYTVIEASDVGDRAVLGPFAHVRPGSSIGEEAHLGNFVETKKTVLGRGAKANHLAYLGDAEIGERANIGAGTIVCNYDGYSKSRAVIGERTFVGSDCQLVAPVKVGDDAYIATGTTVTEDVPSGGFAIGRSRQTTKPDYAAGLRARLQGEKDRKA